MIHRHDLACACIWLVLSSTINESRAHFFSRIIFPRSAMDVFKQSLPQAGSRKKDALVEREKFNLNVEWRAHYLDDLNEMKKHPSLRTDALVSRGAWTCSRKSSRFCNVRASNRFREFRTIRCLLAAAASSSSPTVREASRERGTAFAGSVSANV